MIPPHCVVCGDFMKDKNFEKDKKNGYHDEILVHFVESNIGHWFENEFRGAGHNPDVQWFCKNHSLIAKKYSRSMVAQDAIPLIRRNFGHDPSESIPSIFHETESDYKMYEKYDPRNYERIMKQFKLSHHNE